MEFMHVKKRNNDVTQQSVIRSVSLPFDMALLARELRIPLSKALQEGILMAAFEMDLPVEAYPLQKNNRFYHTGLHAEKVMRLTTLIRKLTIAGGEKNEQTETNTDESKNAGS